MTSHRLWTARGLTKMEYLKFNNNPKGIKTGDCVIRAISLALDKTWDEVFDDLVKIAKEKSSVPNMDIVFFEYLSSFDRITPKVEKGKKRMRVGDLPKGTYIVKAANHVTCVKDGVLMDSWDCRKKCAYRYWIIKEADN